MLVCGSVVKNGWLVTLHGVVHVLRAGNVANLRVECQVGKLVVQLSVELKQRSFRPVKADQSKRIESSDLPADFRTDRTRRARHHDNFSLNTLAYSPLIQMYGLSSQQIFDGDIPDLLSQFCAVDDLLQARDHLVINLGINRELQHADQLRAGCGRYGNQQSLDFILSGQRSKRFSSAQHPLAMEG